MDKPSLSGPIHYLLAFAAKEAFFPSNHIRYRRFLVSSCFHGEDSRSLLSCHLWIDSHFRSPACSLHFHLITVEAAHSKFTLPRGRVHAVLSANLWLARARFCTVLTSYGLACADAKCIRQSRCSLRPFVVEAKEVSIHSLPRCCHRILPSRKLTHRHPLPHLRLLDRPLAQRSPDRPRCSFLPVLCLFCERRSSGRGLHGSDC